ncbi:MAG: hypothetical protein J0L93_01875 [Deltaproteobacteria bacterium]|nr:hypothetical protein [Deltaproteobacteria bacterium]
MEATPEILRQSIQALLNLQEIDAKLFQIKAEESVTSPEILQVQSALAAAQKDFKNIDRIFKEIDRERRSHELRSLTLQEDVKRAESKRRDVRNTKEEFSANKEFESFQKRVAETKKLLSERTEQATQKTVERDEKQKIVSDLEQKLKSLEEERSQRLQGLKQEREKFLEQRNEFISKVDEEIFSLYERVQRIRKGNGIALVKGLVCGGCFVSLPPHTVHQLQKLSEIITCPSCSRILYPADELESHSTEDLKMTSQA